MVVLNRMSRYHLVLEALRRARRVPERGSELADFCRSANWTSTTATCASTSRTCRRFATGSGRIEGPRAQPRIVLAQGGGARDRSRHLGTKPRSNAWTQNTPGCTSPVDDGSIGLATGIGAALEAIGGAFSTCQPPPGRYRAPGRARRPEPLPADRHRRRRSWPISPRSYRWPRCTCPARSSVIAQAARVWPGAVHVACFDTDFFTRPARTSRRLPVPARTRRAGRPPLRLSRPAVSPCCQPPRSGDAVVAHLGSGCSVTRSGPTGSRCTPACRSPRRAG